MLPENVISYNPLDEGRDLRFERSLVVAMGNFDGLHLGHRALLDDARTLAARKGAQLAIVTFDRDPDSIFRSDHKKLCSDKDRLSMLATAYGCPILALAALEEVFSMSPGAFLEAIGSLGDIAGIVVGTNFRFGSHAAGMPDDVAAWCERHGSAFVAHELVAFEGDTVSSTRIRGLLEKGEVASATRLLAERPHFVRGHVVHGRGEGTGFGFATANLDLSQNEAMLPAEGVYAGHAVFDGIAHPAAINVGVARSFDRATAPIEAHVVDFEGDLYDREVRIDFVEWLREPRVFASTEELIETVGANIQWVRDNLKEERA